MQRIQAPSWVHSVFFINPQFQSQMIHWVSFRAQDGPLGEQDPTEKARYPLGAQRATSCSLNNLHSSQRALHPVTALRLCFTLKNNFQYQKVVHGREKHEPPQRILGLFQKTAFPLLNYNRNENRKIAPSTTDSVSDCKKSSK